MTQPMGPQALKSTIATAKLTISRLRDGADTPQLMTLSTLPMAMVLPEGRNVIFIHSLAMRNKNHYVLKNFTFIPLNTVTGNECPISGINLHETTVLNTKHISYQYLLATSFCISNDTLNLRFQWKESQKQLQ